MKSKIVIELENSDIVKLEELEKILLRTVYSLSEVSRPCRLSVDGKDVWKRGSSHFSKGATSDERYPLHHERHIVMPRVPGIKA